MTYLFPSLLKDTCVAGALYYWLLNTDGILSRLSTADCHNGLDSE